MLLKGTVEHLRTIEQSLVEQKPGQERQGLSSR